MTTGVLSMTPLPRITLLVALMALGACRSDPIQFHTLTPAQPAPSSHTAPDEILIEGVSVPPQVDRPQLVIRQGDSSLAILETQWWGATLVDELRSALVDQLSTVRAAHKLSLRVDVQRFDSVPGQYALLDARWRLRAREANIQLTCRSTLQTAAGGSIDEVVIAQQANVKRLVAMISQAAMSPNAGCPASR
ncbi:TPA: membrane integrity-associated transporter subunit PqiC [Pseudomonas putida]|nr:membrane integrity-associated transporter subunit PqiC [Pseudomonas putida]